jgi:hypothetical protein
MSLLKYLFSCTFRDGSFYTQHPEDLPQICKTGSSFADIKFRLEQVSYFSLIDENGYEAASVDLNTGLFKKRGEVFKAHDPSIIFPVDSKLKLIYYRTVTKNMVLGSGVTSSKPVIYNLGWQTNINGKNYQQVISIT